VRRLVVGAIALGGPPCQPHPPQGLDEFGFLRGAARERAPASQRFTGGLDPVRAAARGAWPGPAAATRGPAPGRPSGLVPLVYVAWYGAVRRPPAAADHRLRHAAEAIGSTVRDRGRDARSAELPCAIKAGCHAVPAERWAVLRRYAVVRASMIRRPRTSP